MDDSLRSMRLKTMGICFIGVHIPLTVLCFYAVLNGFAGLETVLITTLISTLVGTMGALYGVNSIFNRMSAAL